MFTNIIKQIKVSRQQGQSFLHIISKNILLGNGILVSLPKLPPIPGIELKALWLES